MHQDLGTPIHDHRHRATRKRGRSWVIGAAVCAALVGGGGAAAFAYTRVMQPGTANSGPAVITSPTAAQAVSALHGFLAAWSGKDFSAAARKTDASSAAAAQLRAYTSGLGDSGIDFTHVTADGKDTSVPHALRVAFHVSAALRSGGSFAYNGAADVLDVNGTPLVHWAPGVLYPGLKPGQSLRSGAIPATTAAVTDRHGRPLTATAYPSLSAVITAVQAEYAAKVQHAPGQGVEIAGPDSSTVKVLRIARPAVPGTIRTTLDATVQAAAEKAVNDPHIGGLPTDIVALDYTNGHVRAVAFRGGDAALNGEAAPGSTMKMITSAALFDKAGDRPTDKVPCVKNTVIDGQTFHNFQMESDPSADLTKDFAISCNTAFIDQATSKLHSGDLREEARDVFGMGDWHIGVPTTDGNVPDEQGSLNLIAAQAIGQGQVTMNTLAMASVVATIADTGFHQPIIIPGLEQPPAKRPISATTASEIRQMMVATATQPYGTAEPRMVGIPGGAKTGTAETITSTNGWFAAYDTANHLAVDALAIGGKEGVTTAGYAARDVLLSQ